LADVIAVMISIAEKEKLEVNIVSPGAIALVTSDAIETVKATVSQKVVSVADFLGN
tara:strand:+ start:402 stop:569 length:168 start_codon:yes stop_codon:yes gene_type:complete